MINHDLMRHLGQLAHELEPPREATVAEQKLVRVRTDHHLPACCCGGGGRAADNNFNHAQGDQMASITPCCCCCCGAWPLVASSAAIDICSIGSPATKYSQRCAWPPTQNEESTPAPVGNDLSLRSLESAPVQWWVVLIAWVVGSKEFDWWLKNRTRRSPCVE